MRNERKLSKLWALYEQAVQDPPRSVNIVDEIYRRIFRKSPKRLREDFCGTFAVGREWISRGRERRALGLDISRAVVREAIRRNIESLSPAEQRRAAVRCADVRTVSPEKADVVLAENFSFFVFKARSELLEYFRACYRSLGTNALLVLDVMASPYYIETPPTYRETIRLPSPPAGLPKKFVHTWDQKRYDPATALGLYSIGFQIGGKKISNAFTYDWRVWTIPEIQECLRDAGFEENKLFWDDEKPRLRLREMSSIPKKLDTWPFSLVGVKRS